MSEPASPLTDAETRARTQRRQQLRTARAARAAVADALELLERVAGAVGLEPLQLTARGLALLLEGEGSLRQGDGLVLGGALRVIASLAVRLRAVDTESAARDELEAALIAATNRLRELDGGHGASPVLG